MVPAAFWPRHQSQRDHGKSGGKPGKEAWVLAGARWSIATRGTYVEGADLTDLVSTEAAMFYRKLNFKNWPLSETDWAAIAVLTPIIVAVLLLAIAGRP